MSLASAQVALAAILGPGVKVGAMTAAKAPAPWPGEAPEAAIPARRAEIAAGRAAARSAMVALGLPEAAVPAGADRAPLWPPGLVGSITHDDGLALAALAPAQHFTTLGIDMEPDGALPEGLLEEICLPEERAEMAPTMGRALFAAKEAAYKAQYPLTGALFGFDGVCITAQGAGRFIATFRSGPLAGTGWAGRWTRAEGRVIAAIAVPAR